MWPSRAALHATGGRLPQDQRAQRMDEARVGAIHERCELLEAEHTVAVGVGRSQQRARILGVQTAALHKGRGQLRDLNETTVGPLEVEPAKAAYQLPLLGWGKAALKAARGASLGGFVTQRTISSTASLSADG